MAKHAALSARQVATTRKVGLFADGGGLYLQVLSADARSWIFRFQLKGRRREMGLGSVAVFSLAEARDKATACRRLLAEGHDPIEHRDGHAAAVALAASRVTTFRKCAEEYIASMRSGWKNAKHAAQWEATLARYVYPIIGHLPVAGIDTGLVSKILQPIWTEKRETARRVRGRIEAVLDFASANEHRAGANPARWRGHFDKILPTKGKGSKPVHHASLEYTELPAFWPRLQAQDGIGARALAHTQGKLEAAYQRGDLFEKRRSLMVTWAGFIEGRSADVLPMKQRA